MGPSVGAGIATAMAVAIHLASARPATAQVTDSAEVKPAHHLPELRVTASRLEASGIPLARLPYAAQVIRLDSMPGRGASTAADLLRGTPGVSFADQFGSDFQPDLRFRGFQAGPVVGYPQSVSVFVDGVRVNEPDASQVNFNLIPLHALERVEVVRAPGGAFGRNTLAGAVNLVTRSGSGGMSGTAEVSAGNFGRWQGEGWAGGEWASGMHYLVSGRLHRSDGWRDLNEARLGQLFSKVGWRGSRTEGWLSYTFVDDHIEAPGSLPRSWLRGNLPPELSGTPDPRRLQFTGFQGDWFAPRLHFVVGNLRRELTAAATLEINGFVRSNRVTQFNDNITEPNVRGETEIGTGGVAAELGWMAASGLALSGGAEYVRNGVGIRIFEEPNGAFPEAGGMTEDVVGRDANLGAFVHAWWPASPRFGFTGSFRYDHIDLPITDRLDPEHSGENTFDQLSGSIGMDWAPAPALRVFGSYGHGFRAPVILELTCADPEDPCPLPFELGADPPLDPVTTDTWQAGIRWAPRRSGHLEVVGYRAEVYDDLFAVVAVPATRGYFKNLDRTRREGAEISAGLRPLPFLQLTGTVGLTRATFQTHATLASALLDDDDPGETPDPGAGGDDPGGSGAVVVRPGDHFAMVPGVTWGAGADYTRLGWSLVLSGAYVGDQFFVGDEANELEFGKLSAYFLLSGRVERRLGGFRVFARGENLLDTDHRTFGVISPNVRGPEVEPQPFVSPGLPRRVTAGIGYVF